MATPRSDVRVAAWELLLRVQVGLVVILDDELQQAAGLPLRWYDLLLELNRAPSRQLRMSELGERVVLSRTRVSRVVEELEHVGLVRREQDDEDRRSWFAVLTDEGRRRFRRAAPHYVHGIEKHFGQHLADAEASTMRDALQRVLAAAGGTMP